MATPKNQISKTKKKFASWTPHWIFFGVRQCASCQHPSRLLTNLKLPRNSDMHLILCRERLIVVSSMFSSKSSSHPSNQILKRNVLASSMMFMLSPIFIRWSVHLSFKTNGPTVSLGGASSFQPSCTCNCVITSFKGHNHVEDDKPRWRHENILLVQRCSSIATEVH